MTDETTNTAPVPGAPTADQAAASNLEGVGTVTDENGVEATDKQKLPGGNLPDALTLTDEEKADAQKQGAIEATKENAKVSYTQMTDGNLPGDPPATDTRFLFSGDVQMFAHLLDLDPDAFADMVAEDRDPPLGEEKVAGLYKLERNGQNRTPYVRALRDRLGLEKGEDVPGAGGPRYTNDISSTTEF